MADTSAAVPAAAAVVASAVAAGTVAAGTVVAGTGAAEGRADAPAAETIAAAGVTAQVAAGITARTGAGVTAQSPTATDDTPGAIRRWGTARVPAGIGAAVLGVALFALILGNPFQAGGVAGDLSPTNSPNGRSQVDASARPGAASPSDGNPVLSPTDPTTAATDDPIQPTNGAPATARPTATPTPRPGDTAAPQTPDPTPRPTPTPLVTSAPTPPPTPTPAPTPPPTPEPTPACVVVPDLVGLTVAKAKTAWTAAGFTGAFSVPNGPGNRVVATQSQPAGACLPPDTPITVTTTT